MRRSNGRCDCSQECKLYRLLSREEAAKADSLRTGARVNNCEDCYESCGQARRCVSCVMKRAHSGAEYPATNFGHETGCPDTTSAAHIGRTCAGMRLLEIQNRMPPIPPFTLDCGIKVIADPRMPRDAWLLTSGKSFTVGRFGNPHAPSLHGSYKRA